MPSLNPFKGIIETTRSPHARTLRTTFLEKVQDAYWVFAGQSSEYFSMGEGYREEKNNHLGFIDYLTLGIPYAFGKLFDLARRNWKKEGLGWKVLVVLAGIAYAPFFLIKHFISSVLTTVSLPVIGFVNLVSQYVAGGAKLKKEISTLIPQETLSNNFVDADINDVIDKDAGIFTVGFVFHQYPHSRWRDTERMTCDFKLGLPIPELGRWCYSLDSTLKKKKFTAAKLPFVEGYREVQIVSELPAIPEEGVLYFCRDSTYTISFACYFLENNEKKSKTLEWKQHQKLKAILEEFPEIKNQTTKYIIITRYNGDDKTLKALQDLTKDTKIFIGNNTVVNKIMSVCGYTIQIPNTGNVGAVRLDPEKDLSAFKSLFTLNVGRVTEDLENSGHGQALLDAVFSHPSNVR